MPASPVANSSPRRRLATLRRGKRFFHRGDAPDLARDLLSILAAIKATDRAPREGVELVAAFFEHDDAALGRADDSDGVIGDVFRLDARDLFVAYAAQCDDKEWLVEVVVRLMNDDGYGVRDSIIGVADKYLPEDSLRLLVLRLWERAQSKSKDKDRARSALYQIMTLAQQLLDAALYEQARQAAHPGAPWPAACADIAEIHLAAGDPDAALAWATKIPEGTPQVDRTGLLLRIHDRLGDGDAAATVAWAAFRKGRSLGSLAALVGAIGESQRAQAIDEAVVLVRQRSDWDVRDAVFLVEVERIADAEGYVLQCAEQLNGDFYSGLLWLTREFEGDGRLVVASVLYRALLESILRRAQSRYYGHGVRYLRKLDKLAGRVSDWGSVMGHVEYVEGLRGRHARKHAFWRKYGG